MVRKDLHDLNEDQWIVGNIAEYMGDGGLFGSLELPEASAWVPAQQQIAAVEARAAQGDVIGAAHSLQLAADAVAAAHKALHEYREGTIGGAETSTTVLQVTAAAGAVAATVATGGAAGAAGAGLFGTAAAVGAGAGAYGVIQEEAGQGGEMIAGTRAAGDFDVEALLKRGGRDAAVGFVGALAGGALSRYAVGKLGGAAFAQLSPAQLAAVAEGLGVEVAALTPQMFVTMSERIIVDFLSGAAVTPLTTAVEVTFSSLTGGHVPESPEAMAKLVLDNAIHGGIVQALVMAITHGSAAAGMPSGFEPPSGQGRSGAANDNVELPWDGPPANDNSLPVPERLAATGTDDAGGMPAQPPLELVQGGRESEPTRAMGNSGRGGRRGGGGGRRGPIEDEVDPSEKASQRNQRRQQERAQEPEPEPQPDQGTPEPDDLAAELAAQEAAQPSTSVIEARFESVEAAIGLVEGKAVVIDVVPTSEKTESGRGLRLQGFKETWYVLDANGTQWTVVHNPSTGDFTPLHHSSKGN